MTDERPEPTPTTIGRYQVIRTLGEGGMGSVFLASDPAIDRLVALKLMRAGFNAGSLRDRFAREARAVGRLHHPNIVTIFEFGEHHGEPFIAMEFVEGQTLASFIGRPDVTLSQQLALMDGLCAGLHYAHRAGIIHRDIKPVNVMVDTEGIVKILDFGIARAAAMSLTQAGTQPGTVLGTLNYMSPEQLSGKAIDQRTDIFAVGAVFYELLTGRQAFPGDIDSGILQLILLTGPTPLAQLRPDLDPSVVAIVNRCLERDVDRRYPDLGAMRQDLAASRHLDSSPRSAGATVILTPVRSPSGISPTPLKTPGPDTRAANEQARRTELEAQINEGREALAREEYTKATDVCRQVLRMEPTHPGALALQAQLDAVQLAREWVTTGQSDLGRGLLTSAAALADRALAVRPAMPEGLKLRAAIEEARLRGTAVSSVAPTQLITPANAATRIADAGATVVITPRSSDPTMIATPAAAGTVRLAPGAISDAVIQTDSASRSASPVAAPAAAPSTRSSTPWMGIAAAAVVVLGLGGYFASRQFGHDAAPSTQAPPTVAPSSAPEPAQSPTPAPPVSPPPGVAAQPPGTAAAEPPPSPSAPKPTPVVPSAPPATSTAPAASKPAPSVPPPSPPSTQAKPAVTAPVVTTPVVQTPPASSTADVTPPSAGGDAGRGNPTTGRGLRGRQDATGSPDLMSVGAAQRGCNTGNAHACTEAGLAFRNGRGVPRDDSAASKFYQRGCDGGDGFGCVDLGQMYASGNGVARDDVHAAQLFQKGCDVNAATGCMLLGNMYQNARGVPRDEQKAFGLFTRACDANNYVACNDAAMMMESGRFVMRDDAKVAAWLRKSCDGNYLLGCRNLGILYEDGRGVPKNDQLALGAFQRACDGHVGVACTNIGVMFQEGRGVPKSDSEAKTFFTKACDAGDQNGCRLKGGG
jgi:TPR repeat protein